MGQSGSNLSPEMLTSIIKAEEAVLESYYRADPAYYAYLARHRAGELTGPRLYPDQYHRTLRELRNLYRGATAKMRRDAPEIYSELISEIRRLERLIGA